MTHDPQRLSTVDAEADLYARMRRCAVTELGLDADPVDVENLAWKYYWGETPDYFREETPAEVEARTVASRRAIDKIKREGGVPW